jgi:hypothetical protein
MKSLRTLVAVSLALSAFSAFGAADASFGRQWMDHYYQNPQPDDLVAAVYSLNQDGYFETASQRDTAIGFFSTVFRQNPAAADGWLRASTRILPDQARRVLAAAAWFAGNPAAARQLRELSADDGAMEQTEISRLAVNGSPTAVGDIAVASEPTMNLQWGAFLASGDQRYISNVFLALGSNQPGLASSARYALAQNAAAYPRVLEICRAELERQPASVRSEFEAALNEAVTRKPGA